MINLSTDILVAHDLLKLHSKNDGVIEIGAVQARIITDSLKQAFLKAQHLEQENIDLKSQNQKLDKEIKGFLAI